MTRQQNRAAALLLWLVSLALAVLSLDSPEIQRVIVGAAIAWTVVAATDTRARDVDEASRVAFVVGYRQAQRDGRVDR